MFYAGVSPDSLLSCQLKLAHELAACTCGTGPSERALVFGLVGRSIHNIGLVSDSPVTVGQTASMLEERPIGSNSETQRFNRTRR